MQFTNSVASAALAVYLLSNSVLGAALPAPELEIRDLEIRDLARRNAACSFHLNYKTHGTHNVISMTVFSPDNNGPHVIQKITTGSLDATGVKLSVAPFGSRKDAKDLVAQYSGDEVNFTFDTQAWSSKSTGYCKVGKVDFGSYNIFSGYDINKENISMDCSFSCGL